MRYYLAGNDVTVPIDTKVGGEFVVPDQGTVTYTVKDNAGADVVDLVDQAITTDANTTRVSVTVPAAANGIGINPIENRFVILKFQYAGELFQIRVAYRLVGFLPYTCTEQEVRDFIGATADELPDEAVDLVRAYFDVKADASSLAENLTDPALMVAANDAITMRAVLLVVPSLRQRLLATEKAGDKSVTRLGRIDFDRLASDAASRYADAILAMIGSAAGDTPLFSVSSPTDVITG